MTVAGFVMLLGACDSDDEPLQCNGHEELCDRPLTEVSFATTHNSMSAKSEPGWSLAAHDTGIREQLEAGVRGFQIDAYPGMSSSGKRVTTDITAAQRSELETELGPEFRTLANAARETGTGDTADAARGIYLCHAFCELGATNMVTAMTWIRDFLAEHPNEVLLIFIEDYVNASEIEDVFDEAGLTDYVYTHDGGEWPTLREMIDSGERVLVMSEHDGGEPAWYHKGFELTQETHYRYETIEAMDCAPNRGQPNSPLFQMNSFISAPNRRLTETVNSYEFLLVRGEQCREERGLQPNIVAVNYYEIGDLIRVVNALNGVE